MNATRLHRRAVIAAVVATWMLAAGPWTGPSAHADEAPTARRYHDWIATALERLADEAPGVAAAADRAAVALADGGHLAVVGDAGLATELQRTLRAEPGGFLPVRTDRPQSGDAVLAILGLPEVRHATSETRRIGEQLDRASELRRRGCVVIGLASRARLRTTGQLGRAQQDCAALLDNHAPAAAGIIRTAAGAPSGPVHGVMNTAVTEAFLAELTRARAQWEADRDPEARSGWSLADRGEAARAAVAAMRAVWRDIGTAAWADLALAAEEASGVIVDGGRVLRIARGPLVSQHLDGRLSGDPGLFLPAEGSGPAGWADLVVAVLTGHHDRPVSPEALLPGRPEHGVTWVANAVALNRGRLPAGGRLVDLWCPPTGPTARTGARSRRPSLLTPFAAEGAMWMLAVEVQARTDDHRRSIIRMPNLPD